jgi:hypothetical protein
MSLRGWLHTCGAGVAVACATLPRIVFGSLLIGGCVWLWGHGIGGPILNLVIAGLAVWGLIKIVVAVGLLAGTPSPDRNARRETRKALRRAGMLRWW